MPTRLILAALLALPLLAGGAANADLRDDCFETVPSFRLQGLVCTKIPGGVG